MIFKKEGLVRIFIVLLHTPFTPGTSHNCQLNCSKNLPYLGDNFRIPECSVFGENVLGDLSPEHCGEDEALKCECPDKENCILMSRKMLVTIGDHHISHCLKNYCYCESYIVPRLLQWLPLRPGIIDIIPEEFIRLYFYVIEMTITIISLILQLVTFTSFDRKNTLFFQSVTALSLSVLMYYINFLVHHIGIILEEVLQLKELRVVNFPITSVLNQFCVLAILSWISIMSFRVWYTTHRSQRCHKYQPLPLKQQSRMFLIFCVIGWVIPAIITVASFLTDWERGKEYGWRINKDKDIWDVSHMCLYFPAAFTLIMDLFFLFDTAFLLCIRRLQKKKNVIDRVSGKRVEMNFLFYARLIFLMSLGWIAFFLKTLPKAQISLHLNVISFESSSEKLEFYPPISVLLLTGHLLYFVFTFDKKAFLAETR